MGQNIFARTSLILGVIHGASLWWILTRFIGKNSVQPNFDQRTKIRILVLNTDHGVNWRPVEASYITSQRLFQLKIGGPRLYHPFSRGGGGGYRWRSHGDQQCNDQIGQRVEVHSVDRSNYLGWSEFCPRRINPWKVFR